MSAWIFKVFDQLEVSQTPTEPAEEPGASYDNEISFIQLFPLDWSTDYSRTHIFSEGKAAVFWRLCWRLFKPHSICAEHVPRSTSTLADQQQSKTCKTMKQYFTVYKTHKLSVILLTPLSFGCMSQHLHSNSSSAACTINPVPAGPNRTPLIGWSLPPCFPHLTPSSQVQTWTQIFCGSGQAFPCWSFTITSTS